MHKLIIELTDEELAGLQKETERQRIEDGVPDLTVEDQAASAVRFLLLELRRVDLEKQKV